MKVQERRIYKPRHIRVLMQEQINLVRQDKELGTIEKARCLAYLSTVSLTAMKDGELEDRIQALEDSLKGTRA